ncbi:hypothetical protein F9B85_05610 [Heliorestis acidaminivorans]|uniref:Methyl-accepting chemotaxis protein n=1 Tax=Heliorestis acidaminivorans TaxID=553427 RepID=A0A6I0F0I9_9FIRM|nr:methyl-accepting chemotaxis protein [Heliorestis acidaminivorans]KAB2953386.1 hypothetical protein F9B85_05610 [Heliorestis acidaminivorans]
MQKSLLKKMVTFSLIITIVPVTLSMLLMFWQVRAEMITNQEERMFENLEGQVRLLETMFEESRNKGLIISHEENIKATLVRALQGEAVHNPSLSAYLRNLFEAEEGLYENIFVVGRNGQVVADSLDGSSVGLSMSHYDFFGPALSGRSHTSRVMESPVSARPIVVVAVPVFSPFEESRSIGAVAMAVEFQQIVEPILERSIGKSGYSFIADNDGMVLAHPVQEMVLSYDLSQQSNGLEQIPALVEEKMGTITYSEQGTKKTALYRSLEGVPIVVVSTMDENEFMARFQNMVMLIAFSTIVLVGLSGIAATLFSKDLAHSLRDLRAAMAHGAAGRLTSRAETKALDERAGLVKAFNAMMIRQGQVVGTVRKSSDDLAASSEEMVATTSTVNTAIGEMSQNMELLAQDADLGNRSVVEVSQVLIELSALIQMAREAAVVVEEKSQLTLSQAEKGKKTVTETAIGMNNIQKRSQELESIIANLNEYTQQIGMITATITGIAEQTNLLALNAAIEAARAGEQGRGFAVVAGEVRKLAEQSTRGAEEVTALLEKVQEQTEKAVLATQSSRQDVERGVLAVQDSGEVLEQILKAIQKAVEEVERIGDITNEEVASSEKIVKLINQVASVIERTSNSATNVAAASEEAAASMEMLAKASEEIRALAGQLRDAVKFFKMDKPPQQK